MNELVFLITAPAIPIFMPRVRTLYIPYHNVRFWFPSINFITVEGDKPFFVSIGLY
jgi:hypothetical protein